MTSCCISPYSDQECYTGLEKFGGKEGIIIGNKKLFRKRLMHKLGDLMLYIMTKSVILEYKKDPSMNVGVSILIVGIR